MTELDIHIQCPSCHKEIHLPYFAAFKAKALEEYDMAELSAQTELAEQTNWLRTISLWGILKWWFSRRLSRR